MWKQKALSAVVVGMACMATSSAYAQMADAVIDRIESNNALSIGYREASIPFSYLNDEQEPVGYSVDICLQVAETLKADLDLPDLTVKWVPVNLQNRIPLVANGTVDISCESAVNTIGRQSQVDFSNPFFVSHTRLLVKTGSGIASLEDMAGKVIAVPINSTPERLIKSLIEEGGLNIDVLGVKDNSEGFLVLQTDRADAYATDDILLFGLRNKAPTPQDYEVVGPPLSYDSYGMLVQKNATVFLSTVDKTMARMAKSGELQELYAEWFEPLGVPLADDLATSFKLQAIPE